MRSAISHRRGLRAVPARVCAANHPLSLCRRASGADAARRPEQPWLAKQARYHAGDAPRMRNERGAHQLREALPALPAQDPGNGLESEPAMPRAINCFASAAVFLLSAVNAGYGASLANKGFVVFDALLYQHKPNLSAFGLRPLIQ